MAQVTIAAINLPNYHEVGTLHELRVFSDRSWIASDGSVVPGRGDSDTYYRSYTLTVNDVTHVAAVPSVVLMSQQDALNYVGKTAKYTAQVYVDGAARDTFLPNALGAFTTPSTPLGTTWGALETYNSIRRDIPASGHPTTTEVQNIVNSALGTLNNASVGVLGRIETTTAPADPAHPKAVEDGDPRVPTQDENDALQGTSGTPSNTNRYITQADPNRGLMDSVATADLPVAGTAGRLRRITDLIHGFVFDNGVKWINALQGNICIEEYATLAAMISDIGSTQRTVYVPNSFACANNATIPSNITLKFTGQGSLALTTGVTVTIQGLIESPRRQIFTNALASQGTVSLVGSVTTTVYPEWWGGGASSVTNASALLAAAAAAAGVHGTVALMGAGTYGVSSDISIGAQTTVRFANGASLNPAGGVTITIVGPLEASPDVAIFTGISSSRVISFAGNKSVRTFYGAWWGMVADGSTDCAAILQVITDQLFADAVEGTVKLPTGVLRWSRALQDTSASNAQYVFPKAVTTQYSLAIEGAAPPSMVVISPSTSGTIIRSTLASGTGSMVGVKTEDSFGRARLNLTLRNLTFETVANPTISAVDLAYVMYPVVENVKIDTGETYNAVTQPTTTSSFGVRTPLNNVVGFSAFRNMVISGFRVGIEWGELSNFSDVTIVNCYIPIHIHDAYHQSYGTRVVLINNKYGLFFDLSGETGFHYIDIDLDIEHTDLVTWFTNVNDVDDINTIGRGNVFWHVILANSGLSQVFTMNGGRALQVNQTGAFTTESYVNTTSPATPLAGRTLSYVDSSDKTLKAKDDAGLVKVVVKPFTAPASNWIHSIGTNGIPTADQPASSDLSDAANVPLRNAANVFSNVTGQTFTGGINPAGGFSLSPRLIASLNAPAITATQGTDTTPVNTETYIVEVFIPDNTTVTGVALLNGSAVAGNVKISLATSAGVPIAGAVTASTAQSGTAAYQLIPFAVAYAAKGPATYYLLVQFDTNITPRFRTHAVGIGGASKKTGETYGTFTTVTPPTTFTTALGPVASLY